MKKYNGTAWVDTTLRQYKTATADIEPTIYTDGTAITSSTIKGNTIQNGTPTPSNPVDANGVGERTENLLSYDYLFSDDYVKESTYFIYYRLQLAPNTQYTIKTDHIQYLNEAPLFFGLSNTMSTATDGATTGVAKTITTGADGIAYIARRIMSEHGQEYVISYDKLTDGTYYIMLNEGSTALPYEPYGYKIPILSGGVTTNIYLGSTQTTRQIKKLVLTGGQDEAWSYNIAPGSNLYRAKFDDLPNAAITECVCSHYKYEFANVDGNLFVNSNLRQITFCDNINATDDTTWRAYLAAQYANGTPVTVWYVLATPRTAAVNEPLMKIGDYADTISDAAQIPTTEGANTITVDTTVQPSEFTATWTGWHDASVKEKSENLFDGVIEQGSITNEGNLDSELRVRSKNYIPVSGLQYTISATGNANKVLVYRYDENKNVLSNSSWVNIPYTEGHATTKYIRILFKNVVGGIDQNITPSDVSNVMVNSGSTALPYEPYWK